MKGGSGIVWLASSDAEISKARDLLRSMSPAGVIDELGFLRLLGGFSDRLYPAMNTIMTRPRYLVFLPAIYRYLEHLPHAKRRSADTVARRLQSDLREALTRSAPDDKGVIGKTAGHDVARLPSNIYWNALLGLGILRQTLPESAYLARLSRQDFASADFKDDDGAVHSGASEYWSDDFKTPHILTQDGTFPPKTSFDLRKAEAKQLSDLYCGLRPLGEESLFGFILRQGMLRGLSHVNVDTPWQVPGLPAALANVVHHAERLSVVAQGSQLQYHGMLFRKRESTDPGTEAAFESWYETALETLPGWDLRAFKDLSCLAGAWRADDIGFLGGWVEAVLKARNPSAAYASATAQECLRKRESSVRRSKARLPGGHYLKTWQEPKEYKPTIHYALDYRHRVGRRFAQDILTALGRGA